MCINACAMPGTMTFFRSAQLILGAMGMAMTLAPMAMSMLMEEEESKDVGQETEAPNDQNKLGVGDGLWLDKSLDSL